MYEDEERGWMMTWCVSKSNNLKVSLVDLKISMNKKIQKEKREAKETIGFLYIYQISWLEKDLEVGKEKKN